MSRKAGFVDWRGLLTEIATEIDLDITRESDLLAVAQFHQNSRGSRARINEVLIEEFNKHAEETINHALIASLGLHSLWTTNYDSLIEAAYIKARKMLDVKTTVSNLSQTLRGRDAVLYKMHGDKSQPQDAVLTKGDYETYNEKRSAFSTILKAELIERTFVFIGFSFTDPNIDYILARVRELLGGEQRDHFCIMKSLEIPRGAGPKELAQFHYDKRRLELRIDDLKRYGIQAVIVDSYAEITDILESLNRLSHRQDILVSGSAVDYSPLGQTMIEELLRKLGAEIIRRGFRLVSGYGLGIGSSVAYGALHEARATLKSLDQIRLMPFAQDLPLGIDQVLYYKEHREHLVRAAGWGIFVCGNRLVNGNLEQSPGVMEEFALLTKIGRPPIPVGASGSAASKLWDTVRADLKRYYGDADVARELDVLNDSASGVDGYIEAIFKIIGKVRPV